MVKRFYILLLVLVSTIAALAQVREVVYSNGLYYSNATMMVDTIYNTTYTRDTLFFVIPRTNTIAYPTSEETAQLIAWRGAHPIYAIPVVSYDSVAYQRDISSDTLRIIFSNTSEALPQYVTQPIVWQHRQVTLFDSTQLLSATQYQSIASGDTALFIIDPTIIYIDTLHIRHIIDTVYQNRK